jgi:hypothetical protein
MVGLPFSKWNGDHLRRDPQSFKNDRPIIWQWNDRHFAEECPSFEVGSAAILKLVGRSCRK